MLKNSFCIAIRFEAHSSVLFWGKCSELHFGVEELGGALRIAQYSLGENSSEDSSL